MTSGEYVSSELQLRDIQTTLITLCEGINKIQETSQPRRKVSRRQFPRDIRRVARRYQDVIGMSELYTVSNEMNYQISSVYFELIKPRGTETPINICTLSL